MIDVTHTICLSSNANRLGRATSLRKRHDGNSWRSMISISSESIVSSPAKVKPTKSWLTWLDCKNARCDFDRTGAHRLAFSQCQIHPGCVLHRYRLLLEVSGPQRTIWGANELQCRHFPAICHIVKAMAFRFVRGIGQRSNSPKDSGRCRHEFVLIASEVNIAMAANWMVGRDKERLWCSSVFTNYESWSICFSLNLYFSITPFWQKKPFRADLWKEPEIDMLVPA